jgi:hypothetical protein
VYLLITIVLALLGAAVGTDLINFSGVRMPEHPLEYSRKPRRVLGPF